MRHERCFKLEGKKRIVDTREVCLVEFSVRLNAVLADIILYVLFDITRNLDHKNDDKTI